MRKHQPIWNQIKASNKSIILAPKKEHDRIIGAVRQEKARDLGYKLLLSEEGRRVNLTVKETESSIEFGLTDAKNILLGTL